MSRSKKPEKDFEVRYGHSGPNRQPDLSDEFYELKTGMDLGWLDRAREFFRAALVLLEHFERDWEVEIRQLRAFSERMGSADVRTAMLDEQLRRRQPRVETPMLVTMGYCIEILLKALLMNTSTIPRTESGFLAKWLKTHNLEELHKKSGIPCTPRQRDFLRFLTSYTTGDARYPVTTSGNRSLNFISMKPAMLRPMFIELYLAVGEAVVTSSPFFQGPMTLHGVEGVTLTVKERVEYLLLSKIPDRVARKLGTQFQGSTEDTDPES